MANCEVPLGIEQMKWSKNFKQIVAKTFMIILALLGLPFKTGKKRKIPTGRYFCHNNRQKGKVLFEQTNENV